MEGILEAGSTITIQMGFYDCNEVKKNDVVICSYSPQRDPAVKIVKGLPGDRLDLRKSGNAWNIKVNRRRLKNRQGAAYSLDERRIKMLQLYIKDYKGKIPRDAYLILGNRPEGSFDSTRFGLVDRSSLVGRVTE